MKRNFLKPVLLFLPVIVLASCNIEENEGKIPVSKNGIVFAIGENGALTKAADEVQVMDPISLAGDDKELKGLILTETVTSMDGMFFEESRPVTKGTPIYSENFVEKYGKYFYVTAYTLDGKVYYDPLPLTYKESKTDKGKLTHYFEVTYPSGIRWPEVDGVCQGLNFLLDAPHKQLGVTPSFDESGNIVFTYADKTPSDGTITDPAASQKDILFGSIELDESTKDDQTIVNLHHAFTAVKFRIADFDTHMGAVTKINSVVIKDLSYAGKCAINPATGVAVWSGLSGGANYSQKYSGYVTFDESTYKNNFAPSFYEGDTEVANLNNGDASETLLLIPQNVKDKKVTVNFTINGVDYTRTFKMPDTNWAAGQLHTYTIDISKVAVKVDDEVDNSGHKTNVVTKNTGNVTAYLRAAVSAAWYYGDLIVAPYKEGDGVFVDLPNVTPASSVEGKNGYWIDGGDGYYYYSMPVLPGEETNTDLFTSFTQTNTPPFPYDKSDKAHLEVRVLLQGVEYNSDQSWVKAAWGNIGESLGATAETPISTSNN